MLSLHHHPLPLLKNINIIVLIPHGARNHPGTSLRKNPAPVQAQSLLRQHRPCLPDLFQNLVQDLSSQQPDSQELSTLWPMLIVGKICAIAYLNGFRTQHARFPCLNWIAAQESNNSFFFQVFIIRTRILGAIHFGRTCIRGFSRSLMTAITQCN